MYSGDYIGEFFLTSDVGCLLTEAGAYSVMRPNFAAQLRHYMRLTSYQKRITSAEISPIRLYLAPVDCCAYYRPFKMNHNANVLTVHTAYHVGHHAA